MMNKKGLSDIIATVLIILLALAAVVIVWQFIRPVIEKGGQSVSLQSKCLDVEAVPTKCTTSGPVGGPYVTSAVIQLTKGSPADIDHIIAIAEKADGTSITNSTVTAPTNTLGTTTASFAGNLSGLYIIKEAAVVTDGAGHTQACGESSQNVAC